MSIAINDPSLSRDEKNRLSGVTQTPFVSANRSQTAGEGFITNFAYFKNRWSVFYQQRDAKQKVDASVDALLDSGFPVGPLLDLPHSSKVNTEELEFQQEGDMFRINGSEHFQRLLRDNEDLIKEHQAQNPGRGIQTWAEIEASILEDQERIIARQELSSINATGFANLGKFAGAVSGVLVDPINAATMLLPWGLGVASKFATVAGKAAAIGASESALITGTEILQTPRRTDFRRRFGEEELTNQQVLKELGVTALATAALGAAVGGVVFGIAAARAATVANRKSGRVPETTLERDVNQYAENVSDIATEIPEGINPKRHFDAYNKARSDIENNLDIDVSTQLNRDAGPSVGIRHQDLDTTPIDLDFAQVQERMVRDTRAALKVKDKEILDTGFENGKSIQTTRSAREAFKQFDEDIAGVDFLTKCLRGGK